MEHVKMRWQNLRRNKCPICSSELSADIISRILECKSDHCDFVITEDRFSKLVMKMNKEGLERAEYHNGEEVEDLMKGEFE